VLVLLLGGALQAFAGHPVNGEEYRVYEAALGQLAPDASPELHVAIYNRTLSGACNQKPADPVLVKGCSFLWIKPQGPEDVERLLHAHWRKFPKSAWKDFLMQNAASGDLHEPILTPWKHRLVGERILGDDNPGVLPGAAGARAEASGAAWQKPDMTVFLSRVGFDSKRSEAILYILVFSYVDQAAVTGDYLRFRREVRRGSGTSWSLAGRLNYFTGVKDSFAWRRPQHGNENGHKMPQLRLAGERK